MNPISMRRDRAAAYQRTSGVGVWRRPPLGLGAVVVMVAAALLWTPRGTSAQEPVPVDSLRREVALLQAQVDSLMRLVQRLEAQRVAAPAADTATEDPLAALRAAAAAAAAEGRDTAGAAPEEEPRFVGRQRNLQSLNPEITVTGDVLGVVDLDDPGTQTVVPREFEASFQSSLDPYSVAKVFVGFHGEGAHLAPFHAEEEGEEGEEEEEGHGHGGEVAVEEGYIQWQGLPGGFNVTLGRFRQRFGQLNRWHPHALPGQSYPLPYVAFFGEEGLAQAGVSVHWLVPVSGLGTWEIWTELTNSDSEALFGEADRPTALAHLNGFWELGRSTYFELGFTGVAGPERGGADDFATRVGGVDFTLSWRPPEMGRYRELTVRGGAVRGALALPGLPREDAWGAFANGELRLSQRWIIGGRFGYTENPLEPSESSWLAAPTLTLWQSEWVRLRAEMGFLDRPEGMLRMLTIQSTFAMGPHKHETY